MKNKKFYLPDLASVVYITHIISLHYSTQLIESVTQKGFLNELRPCSQLVFYLNAHTYDET